MVIDRIDRYRPAPDEAGPVGQEGNPADAPTPLVADGHRQLAGPAGVNQSRRRDLGQRRIAQVEGGLAGHVARRAIGELRRDAKLLGSMSRGVDPLGGSDPDRSQPRGRGQVVACTGADPVAQSPGFLRIRREPDSSLVGQPAGGLEQRQAPIGRGSADATAEQIASQRTEIEFRIVTAEAEAKPPFARRVAVAGAHVAACFGQQRHDVVAVADWPLLLGLRLDGPDVSSRVEPRWPGPAPAWAGHCGEFRAERRARARCGTGAPRSKSSACSTESIKWRQRWRLRADSRDV